jgi:hypothetical protein
LNLCIGTNGRRLLLLGGYFELRTASLKSGKALSFNNLGVAYCLCENEGAKFFCLHARKCANERLRKLGLARYQSTLQTLLVVLGKRELECGAGTLIRRGPQPSTVILNNGAANR